MNYFTLFFFLTSRSDYVDSNGISFVSIGFQSGIVQLQQNDYCIVAIDTFLFSLSYVVYRQQVHQEKFIMILKKSYEIFHMEQNYSLEVSPKVYWFTISEVVELCIKFLHTVEWKLNVLFLLICSMYASTHVTDHHSIMDQNRRENFFHRFNK